MNGMEQQIQAAAEKLFLHYGFRKTSVDQIAREAGIGKGTIYNYFRNKEELFGSCSRHWRNLIDEYLHKHCDHSLEQPARWIQKVELRLQFIRKLIGPSLVTESVMKELVEATFLLSDHEEELLEETLLLVEEGQQTGSIRPELDKLETAKTLLQMERLSLADWETVCEEVKQLHELIWYGLHLPEQTPAASH
jgi:AcrR family transcriptional regulator